MDAPAKAYILGVKSHNAKSPCTRCHAMGTPVEQQGLATKASKHKRAKNGNAFLNLNAPLQKSLNIGLPVNIYQNAILQVIADTRDSGTVTMSRYL